MNIPGPDELSIIPAMKQDVPEIIKLIRELAEYEKLLHEVEATEQDLLDSLFGANPVAETLMLHWQGKPAGYSIFFHNFSTFLGRPGLYVEDIYVRPQFRRKGIARACFYLFGRSCRPATLWPSGMGGLGLERIGKRVLPKPGRRTASRLADHARHRSGACEPGRYRLIQPAIS